MIKPVLKRGSYTSVLSAAFVGIATSTLVCAAFTAPSKRLMFSSRSGNGGDF